MNIELCRLCGKDSGLTCVFEEKDLCLKIFMCFGVKVERDDDITQKVCKSCYFFTNSVYEFRLNSIAHDAKLKSLREESQLVEVKPIISYPSEISQDDFLNTFNLANKSDTCIKKPVCHPSVAKLKRKFSNINIPEECYEVHIDPVVMLGVPPKLLKLNADCLGVWSISRRRLSGKDLILTRVRSEQHSENDTDIESDTVKNDSPVPVVSPKTPNNPHRKRKIGNCPWTNTHKRKRKSKIQKVDLPKKVQNKITPPKPINPDPNPNPVNLNSTNIERERRALNLLTESDAQLNETPPPPENLYLDAQLDETPPPPQDLFSNVGDASPPRPEEYGNLLITAGESVPTFICQTCNKIFDTLQLLDEHKKVSHKSNLRCPKCSKKYAIVESLVGHTVTCHPELFTNESDVFEVQSVFLGQTNEPEMDLATSQTLEQLLNDARISVATNSTSTEAPNTTSISEEKRQETQGYIISSDDDVEITDIMERSEHENSNFATEALEPIQTVNLQSNMPQTIEEPKAIEEPVSALHLDAFTINAKEPENEITVVTTEEILLIDDSDDEIEKANNSAANKENTKYVTDNTKSVTENTKYVTDNTKSVTESTNSVAENTNTAANTKSTKGKSRLSLKKNAKSNKYNINTAENKDITDSDKGNTKSDKETIKTNKENVNDNGECFVIDDDSDIETIPLTDRQSSKSKRSSDSSSSAPSNCTDVDNSYRQQIVVVPSAEDKEHMEACSSVKAKITNEINFVNYIFNKCSYVDKPKSEKKWFLRDVDKFTEKTYLPIELVMSTGEEVNVEYGPTTTEKPARRAGFWDSLNAIDFSRRASENSLLKENSRHSFEKVFKDYAKKVCDEKKKVLVKMIPNAYTSTIANTPTISNTPLISPKVTEIVNINPPMFVIESPKASTAGTLQNASTASTIPRSTSTVSLSVSKDVSTAPKTYGSTNTYPYVSVITAPSTVSKPPLPEVSTASPIPRSNAYTQISNIQVLSNVPSTGSRSANATPVTCIANVNLSPIHVPTSNYQIVNSASSAITRSANVVPNPVFPRIDSPTNYHPQPTKKLLNFSLQKRVQNFNRNTPFVSFLPTIASNVDPAEMPQMQSNGYILMGISTQNGIIQSGSENTVFLRELDDSSGAFQINKPLILNGMSYPTVAKLRNPSQTLVVQQLGQQRNVNTQNCYNQEPQENTNSVSEPIVISETSNSPLPSRPAILPPAELTLLPAQDSNQASTSNSISISELTSDATVSTTRPSIRIKNLSELRGDIPNTAVRNELHNMYSNTLTTYVQNHSSTLTNRANNDEYLQIS